MRILFILTLTTLVRHFESVIMALAERGHSIRIATPGHRTNWPLPDAMAAHPRVSQVTCPEQRDDEWKKAATNFRLLVDYARYLDGPFQSADKLRQRAFKTLIRTLTDDQSRHAVGKCPTCRRKIVDDDLGRMLLGAGPAGAGKLREILHLVEGIIPSDRGREEFLQDERPDLLLVSPLVGLGSEQADWVKSARNLKIPVGFPVFSWDNLTTKGIIHVQPDVVYVWNDIQKREAVEYHGVPEERVVITGAPRFDEFFAMSPKSTREKFCERYGLDPAQPTLAYLCSSEFVAGNEVEFIGRWIDEIRTAPELASVNVLIRPHPRSVKQWSGVDLSRWPRTGLAMSRGLNADQLLYDTLYHSAAVVGLNTSAQIEAAILGKPVYTILAPGFELGQQGTLHFRYLLADDGGFVQVARDFDEHRRHLGEAVTGRYDRKRISDFVERFVRPAGLHHPATPLLASAIEAAVSSTHPSAARSG